MIQNTKILLNHLPIAVFIIVAVLISVFIMFIPKVLAPSAPQKDKLSSYECGFDSFGDARSKFDIRFYLVAILFIVFDIEIAFLLPWAISLKEIGSFGFYSMMIFLLILTAGFIYEWKTGALEWE